MLLGKCSPAGWLFVVMCCVALVRPVHAHGQAPDVTVDTTRDTLVYKDGDRIHGLVVEQNATVIVFKSDRFGILRVAAADAVVIKAEKPPETVAKEVVAAGIKPVETAKEREEQEKVTIWDRFSPAVLTAKVRDFFGPWHGRLAFSNEIVTDTSHRNNIALEGKLSRKFTNDAVDLSARYDYDQVDGTVSQDVFKSVNSWRHDFNRIEFVQYRPTLEWNRANVKLRAGYPTDYVLLQQEIGFGLNVWTRPGKKVRVGASENLFDIWGTFPTSSHSSRAVASLFEEVEMALPWRMALTQRGVWYPEMRHAVGWEDQIELNKKLTETLSLALRHEIRRHNPDGASQDYTRLKLLLGLDF